ncbi:MAG: hypothetical protein CM1200mP10_06920 [Candidatus Neomarinimicrobiota bacterium]|nr:MAG: hypothetical protein CM1200mP10_06920 [Candidatus Neomarinimicrobiota bacterium]
MIPRGYLSNLELLAKMVRSKTAMAKVTFSNVNAGPALFQKLHQIILHILVPAIIPEPVHLYPWPISFMS